MIAAEVSERRIEQALRLIVSAEMEAPPADAAAQARLAQWSARSAAHAAACVEAQHRWQALGRITPALRTQFAEPSADAAARRPAFGAAALALAVVALCAGLLGGWQQWQQAQPVFSQTISSGTAQVVKLTLPDGSRLDLSAQTTLAITLYRHRREVALAHGEAHFEVAPDRARPFRVSTDEGVVEVVGTAFTVADRGGVTTIAVEHGHVRFQPADRGHAEPRPAIDLHGGDALTVRDRTIAALTRINTADIGAWRQGWLVFDNTPLVDALPAINAFRTRPLIAASADIGQLHLTGRFRASDEAGLIAALPVILPLRTQTQADGTVLLSAR